MRLGLSIHQFIDSDHLEARFRMVYCAAFDCNANNSKNRATCSWCKFPMELTLLSSRMQVMVKLAW